MRSGVETVDDSNRVGVRSCQMRNGVETVDESNRAVKDRYRYVTNEVSGGVALATSTFQR